ncbi:MAG: GTPase Era [Magnetospiraceae bacterium]
MSDEGTQTRCGFAAVLGAPNAGKSTLVNAAVGTKVSIVTHKVQTTRARVMGICLRDHSQIVFVDTPGIFAPRRRLDRAMVAAAWQGANDADAVLLLVDAKRGPSDETTAIIKGLKKNEKPCILVLNKVDLVAKPVLLDLAARLGGEKLPSGDSLFAQVFMISALEGEGVDDLVAYLAEEVAPGPWMFPEDQVSDMPLRLLAADVTREKILLQIHKEIPYKITVETESWTENPDGSARVDQIIFVERDTHKAMVLGKGGAKIKRIGADARKDLEDMLDRRVHLFLRVKLKSWQDDPARYREWGLDFQA